MILHPFFPRLGHGEHRRHLCGAGVWPAGGHFNGGAGVCVDVEADPRKWGETGLSNLHLLCLSVPSLAPAPSWSYEAFQLPALTGEATLPPSVKPERNNQHKAKDVPHIYLRVHIHIFSIYSNRNCLNNTHNVVSINVILFKVNRFLLGASNKFTDTINRVNVCLLSFRGFPDKAVSCCLYDLNQNKQSNQNSLPPPEGQIL